MHISALASGRLFFETYAPHLGSGTVVDIGAQDVNGSLKSCCPPGLKYIGVDFAHGKGVDVVLQDPYILPFEDDSMDVVVSSSCFEHSELFWVLFLEILRILKPDGLFYLNAPSNGPWHRYPVDCWRFYPDSGNALVTWARRNGFDAALLESFIGNQGTEEWNDFIAVFLKSRDRASIYPDRMLARKTDFTNGIVDRQAEILNAQAVPEDGRKLAIISDLISGRIEVKS